MLSSAYALNVTSAPPSHTNANHAARDIKAVATIFLMLLIIDIAIMIFAIYATVKCSEAKKWSALIPILIIACMILLPGIGGILAIGMIIYYFTGGCGANREALKFQYY